MKFLLIIAHQNRFSHKKNFQKRLQILKLSKYLSEESVKAANFFLSIHMGILLSEILQGDIVHEVEDFATRKPFVLEFLNCAREGRRKQ